jgi:hypothetical protein
MPSKLLDRLRGHARHRPMRAERVPVDVDPAGERQSRATLGLHDPELQNLRRKLCAVVGAQRPRAAQVAHGFECFESPRRARDRLGKLALYDVLGESTLAIPSAPNSPTSTLNSETTQFEPPGYGRPNSMAPILPLGMTARAWSRAPAHAR